MNEYIKTDKNILKILEECGTETSLMKDIEKINSNKYTMMYTTRDHEVSYLQVDTVKQIEECINEDSNDHESGWELEHIFRSGKRLKYKIHQTATIEFIE